MTAPNFIQQPDPDHPGWMSWTLPEPDRFNSVMGKFLVRLDEDGQARVRMLPAKLHTNLSGNIHGGATLAFIDMALFAAGRVYGLEDVRGAVTLDLSTQFIGAGRPDEPMDAVVELLRETGRLLFMRGLVVQGDHKVASFAGTLRKANK